jgi:hypothetical protein
MYALEDPDTKALIVGPDKSNLGTKGGTHWFEKTPAKHFESTADSDGTVALLESVADDDRSIQDLLAERADISKPARKTNVIDLWVKEILSSGPVLSADLFARGSAEGYSQDQVRGARDRLGVKPIKEGNKWVVRL